MRFTTIIVIAVIAAAAWFMFSGDSGDDQELVDLDKVLDALVVVLERDAAGSAAGATAAPPTGAATAAKPAEAAPTTTPAQPEDPKRIEAFLGRYAAELNRVHPVPGPVGVRMAENGAIEGFADADTDNVQDAGEDKLFEVEIDAARSRLVATDVQEGYARDHGMRLGGLGMGMMLGMMMSRQNGFYNGAPSHLAAKNVSPRGYHSEANTRYRARTSGGSSGFRSGK